jgi:hypothetical protein
MSDPIVIELQRLASDRHCPVDELLRKALIVSTKLQIADFTAWIRYELDGYQGKEIPDYRIVPTSLKAINPANGLHIPIFSDTPGRENEFSRAPVSSPVGELTVLIQSKSEFFQIALSNNVQRRLHHNCDMPVPMECYLRVSLNSVFGILDAVRNTILQWALQLEQDGILGEGMRFTSEEKAIAMTSQNIHISNFQGILGNVNESTVNQSLTMSIKSGDFNSLQKKLAESGISENDLRELRSALDADPKPDTPSEFGPRVSEWIGNMITKAASGAWKVTVDTAAKLIPEALAAYYGIGG